MSHKRLCVNKAKGKTNSFIYFILPHTYSSWSEKELDSQNCWPATQLVWNTEIQTHFRSQDCSFCRYQPFKNEGTVFWECSSLHMCTCCLFQYRYCTLLSSCFWNYSKTISPCVCVCAFFRVHCHNLYVILALRNSKSICLILGICILCSYLSDSHKGSQFFLFSLSICFLHPPSFFNNFIDNLWIDSRDNLKFSLFFIHWTLED